MFLSDNPDINIKSHTMIYVEKYSGEKEPYSEAKLEASLLKSGAELTQVMRIKEGIKALLYDGISTHEIYQLAYEMLQRDEKASAGRYKLRKAIMELGPTGYPFEQYIGEMFKHDGYKVQVGVQVKGYCVGHEVDVVAEKENNHYMIECKFHSDQRRKCDVKIPLYINARFHDVRKVWEAKDGHALKFHQGWLVTNTKMTDDAIQYGSCAGLQLLSWDFPKKGNLKELINEKGLHPITCLSSLKKKHVQHLTQSGIVLCKSICEAPNILKDIGLTASEIKEVITEGTSICN